jgi:murein DD-endopeptidase MepM/ murein hydrolase activator NlpD
MGSWRTGTASPRSVGRMVDPLNRAAACGRMALGRIVLVLALAAAPLLPLRAVAQDAGTYTVAPGDTLGAIANRFGVTIADLVAFNGIADPNLLAVGQVLAIPGSSSTAIAATGTGGTGAVAYTGPTGSVRARPGDTIARLAARYSQDPGIVAALNNADPSARLFPGQPVSLPADAAPSQPALYFGAITNVEVTPNVVQGRTGHVYVEAARPLAVTATFMGAPLVFSPIHPDGLRQFALIPIDALLEPGVYDLVLSYTTARGLPVSRTWQITVDDGGYESQQIVVSDDKAAQMTPDAINAEREKVVGIWSQVSPILLWGGPFVRPIDPQYPTTSPFGTRRAYSVADIGNFHAGQDFGAPEGVLVTAPAAGTVVMAEPVTVRGNAVILDHGRGIFSGYWHLSEIKVAVGQQVAAGDVLGIVGNTGLSTGAHLHWELRVNGVAVDPMQFLDESVYQ